MPLRTAATTLDTCRDIAGRRPAGSAPVAGPVPISATVGINGRNVPADVRTIQDALNRVAPDDGGAAPALLVDGICGPKTSKAIQQFQLKQFGWSGADGRVDPGGPTNRRLNELVGQHQRSADAGGGTIFHELLHETGTPSSGPAVNSAPDGLLMLGLTGTLQVARRWIHAAVQNLDMALVHVDASDGAGGAFPSMGRSERMRQANRYFRIDDFPRPLRGNTLERVRHVFLTMLQVFDRPGGLWGEKAFAVDSTGVTYAETSTATAHTVHGGFFRPGEPNIFQAELRGDTIFFVRENIAYFAQYPRGVKTIVHELAHFCGDHRTGWAVLDFDAYGEPEAPPVARLPLDQRVRHADSYARFAQAVAN